MALLLLPLQALGEGVQHCLAMVSAVTGGGVKARDVLSVEEAYKSSLPCVQLDEDRALLLLEALVQFQSSLVRGPGMGFTPYGCPM